MIRIFSDLSYEENIGGGTTRQERIPVMYGDPSRMVASLLRENSDNTVMPSPMMSVWIKGIAMAPGRRQDPSFIGVQNIIERNHSPDGGYGMEPGNMYTLERYMPVPYDMTFQLDIWTTSTTTKLQIMEQLLTWFNDRLQLQQNDNVLDWSNIFEVILTDVQWSSRSVPGGNTTERDVASLTFEVPVWISPPAKLKSKQWIEQIVTNIYDIKELSDTEIDDRLHDPFGCFNELSQLIITPGDYKLEIGNEGSDILAKLINNDPNTKPDWSVLLQEYGLEAEFTDMYIKTDNDIESEDGDIISGIEFTDDPSVVKLTLDQDTVPGTLAGVSPVLRNVNPLNKFPGGGLDAAAVGQRYLIVSDSSNGEEPAISSLNPSDPWGVLTTYPGDIIQYNGANWEVIFEASTGDDPSYVINSFNMQHYKFTDGEWIFTYLGTFNPGYWRLYSSK
jgi:hypothetical protein